MKVFQPFRLDTVNHCLWCADKRVELTPKAFDVLRYLVEHSDRLVTQDEILEALWPGTYVNPEVVKKYVLGIRKVLGDNPQNPTFVATFPKRGYQFIAAVREESSGSPSEVSANTPKAMVGREDALAQLDDCLSKALNGQRRVLFITGEAGIGKTTLLDVFQQRAATRPNLRIARGQCVEGFGGKEAYYPVLEALGQWFRAEDGGPVVHTLAKQAPTWLIQFPSLVKADQRAALQKEILGATRERMVREICETLETLTAQDALVLILEDLHWVDPSTLDFISALARRRGPAKLLLLGTYRPADVIISQSPLRTLKQDLVLHNLSCEISLERLERADVAEYLAMRFADGGLPAGFADLIYRHSGGNALFMVAILQDLVKKEIIKQHEGRWTLRVAVEKVEPGVPETLDQLIELQFKQLTPVEQRVLRSASVAGERFSVWAITTAAEVDPASMEDTCERLADRLQFIKPAGIHELANGQISTHYDFRHSLYREVLYRRLPESARSKLHLLLAQRLKTSGDPCEQELASELALHFEGGHDHEQAVRYLILAAENAAGRFAYRDSIEILQHALELAVKLGPALRNELEVQVLECIGNAHFALGALVPSAEAYAAAADRAQLAGLKTAQMHALISAMYPLGFIDPVKGIIALEEAVKVSKSINNPAQLASTQMLAAGCRLVFGTWNRADANLCTSSYETLLHLDPSKFDPYQQVAYAHVTLLKGNYAETLELCERSVSEASISRVGHVVNFLVNFGALSARSIAFLYQGELGKALQLTQVGRASPDENLALYWQASFREASLRTQVFDFEGARQICQETGMVGGEHPIFYGQTIHQMAVGYIAVQSGNFPEATKLFREVYEPPTGPKFFLHWWWRLMARLECSNAWLMAGDISSARISAEDFLESALSTADPFLQALAWDLKARVAMAERDLTGAREYIQRALTIVDKFEIPVAAWQACGTAWQLHQQLKEQKKAEANRERAESCILKIANSFEPDEPLRKSFLNAAPVRRILFGRAMNNATRQRKLKRSAAP
jgi:DNA-binding winged helix-turn-helix (wHTH) protein/tetratricopeptide (TPR) repeat protein